MLWFRTYIPSSTPMATIKFFFINLVITYRTLNSMYMQLLRGMFGFVKPREILRSFVARGMFCLKLV